MLINPRYAIEQGWITWNDKVVDIEKHIQPNAIDFDCAWLYEAANPTEMAFLTEQGKKLRSLVPVEPKVYDGVGLCWKLEPRKNYDASSNFHLKVPENVACKLVIRSTLSRSNLLLSSGLFDSGFGGQAACALINNGDGPFLLGVDTRIGQIEFWKSDSEGTYKGGYNHEQGTHWANKA